VLSEDIMGYPPKIAEAKYIADRFQKTKVILIMLDDENATIEYASYGKTPELCKEAKIIADVAYESVLSFLAS
jgi:hypothetical protein